MSDGTERRLANYHTHTWRCQHALGTEEEYVQRAIDEGFGVLGFADHTPWPYESDYVSGMRMRLDQLRDYLDTVRGLRERYAGRIRILLGLECEAFPQYMGWLSEIKARALDYLILGNHYDRRDDVRVNAFFDDGGFYFGSCTSPEHVRRYAEDTIEGMRTGLFDCVAHPDLFCHVYRGFDAECAAASHDICAAAAQLRIPLEYNLLGVQYHEQGRKRNVLGYPCPQFWEIAARHGCRAIIGFDAHRPEHLGRIDLFHRGRAFLRELGIETLSRLDRPGL